MRRTANRPRRSAAIRHKAGPPIARNKFDQYQLLWPDIDGWFARSVRPICPRIALALRLEPFCLPAVPNSACASSCRQRVPALKPCFCVPRPAAGFSSSSSSVVTGTARRVIHCQSYGRRGRSRQAQPGATTGSRARPSLWFFRRQAAGLFRFSFL